MKNFGSILAFIAVSATLISSRALPETGTETDLLARAPVPNVMEFYARSPRNKHNKGDIAAAAAANDNPANATQANAATNKKKAKGTAAVGVSAAASTGTTKKGKGNKGAAKATGAQVAAAASTGTATKKGNNAANTATDQSLAAEIEAELSSLGLRDLPILESRKKHKNGTAAATGAAGANKAATTGIAGKKGKHNKGAAKGTAAAASSTVAA